jgi:hypothetical protein
MGLLDKAREAAAQATVKAQEGIAQGQAKASQMQAKWQADKLLTELGAAYYAQQRHGGPAEAVAAALAAVDAHVAANPTGDTRAAPGEPTPPPPGGYGLDDL